jgi:hypothetical protein
MLFTVSKMQMVMSNAQMPLAMTNASVISDSTITAVSILVLVILSNSINVSNNRSKFVGK